MSALPVVLVYAEDLLFTSRIREAAKDAAVEVRVARNARLLGEALAAVPGPVLVLADLDAPRLQAAATIAAHGVPAEATVVGFFSHVHVTAAAAARAAGFHKALARSAFVRELPELIRRAAAST